MNHGIVNLFPHPAGYQKIVNSPACILGSGLESVRPPGVFDFLRVEEAISVRKAAVQQLLEGLPLLNGVAGILLVCLGIFQVNCRGGDIQVAADDHGLLPIQPSQVIPEGFFPGQAVINSGQLLLGVWGIAGDQEKVWVFQGDQPPFGIQLRRANAVGHGKRGLFGKDSRAGVALFLGGIPELAVARGFQLNLPRLQFGFLQTEKVGVRFLKIIQKALGNTGPQAVNIPGDEFHRESFLFLIPFGGQRFPEWRYRPGKQRHPASG